jgi:hypothetical protein
MIKRGKRDSRCNARKIDETRFQRSDISGFRILEALPQARMTSRPWRYSLSKQFIKKLRRSTQIFSTEFAEWLGQSVDDCSGDLCS